MYNLSRNFKPKSLQLFVKFRHKLNKNTTEVNTKLSAEVLSFLNDTPSYSDLKDKIPKILLKKYKTPENMYLIDKNTAQYIAKTIKPYLPDNTPIIEVNPGFCFLSTELLKRTKCEMYLYETTSYFNNYLSKLVSTQQNKVSYKIDDFFAMWKLAFQDKMDNGTRVKDLLGKLAVQNNDRIVKIIGAMPSISFIKHLMHTIIFHSTTNLLGKPDLYITMPIKHYEFLTDKEIQFSRHKTVPAMFQLLFDYEILTKVPSAHYLPWMYPTTNKKTETIEHVHMYVVKITQKSNLPCKSEYLPLLWYFFKPHMTSKSRRVIPMLEQWIPGCGVWLITGQDPPDTNKELAPNQYNAPLPHMTIFTEFGDLTLNQKLTVFKRFISWPEFEQSPFRATMENNLPKFIAGIDINDKDNMGVPIEDDDTSDSENI